MSIWRRLAPLALLLTIFGNWATKAPAQAIGRCVDQARGQSFLMFPDLTMVQEGNPYNRGQAVRDPSGMTFMRISAVNPMAQAFFLDWSGRIIEINPTGWVQIGYCQFATHIISPNPYNRPYRAPQMADWGVRVPGSHVIPVPQAFADTTQRYVPPLYASAETAQACMDSSESDQDQFADCMLHKMLGQKERQIYDCSQDGADKIQMAVCMVGAVGGANERRAAQQIGQCYSEHKDDWEQYPLCMTEQNIGGEAAKLLNCVRKQSEAGEVTFAGTAFCYGAGTLHLNPEWQIAAECAATSGGEPFTFAGCAGGRLTVRELQKCLTDGVGGNGCFGPNNEIVKALRSVGIDLNEAFGPNNDLVRTWNNGVHDLQHGPGPNNEVVKVFSTVGNDIVNGPGPGNDIVRAIDNVIPGFSSLF